MPKKILTSFFIFVFAYAPFAFSAGEDIYLNTTESEEFTIWDEDNTTTYFSFEGENEGQLGIGTADPSAPIHVVTGQNDTEEVMILDNSAGTNGDVVQFFVSTVATPESNIVGNIGDVVIATTAGEMFVKQADDGLNTGWTEIEVVGGGSGGSLDAGYNTFGATASLITIDAAEGQTGGLEWELSATNNPNMIVDMQGTGDFVIQDAGTAVATFADDGSIDFGTATSFEIPDDVAVDAAGEITLDTTDGTLVIHDGTAARVFADDIFQVALTIESDGDWDAEAVPFWTAPQDMAITIVDIDATVLGTGQQLQFNIEERTNGTLGTTGTDVWNELTADGTGITGAKTLANAGIAATNYLVFTTGTSVESGTVTSFHATIYYRKDVE